MSFTTHSLRRVCVRAYSTPNSRAFFPHSSFLNTATQARNMATGKKREWLCILPDKANVLERRKEVKSQHYEAVKPLVASGKLVAGGAMFEKHPVDGEPALFKGSVIVYTGDSAEEVHKLIANDAYARGGVWDLEKAQIIPYVPAVREPLS